MGRLAIPDCDVERIGQVRWARVPGGAWKAQFYSEVFQPHGPRGEPPVDLSGHHHGGVGERHFLALPGAPAGVLVDLGRLVTDDRDVRGELLAVQSKGSGHESAGELDNARVNFEDELPRRKT